MRLKDHQLSVQASCACVRAPGALATHATCLATSRGGAVEAQKRKSKGAAEEKQRKSMVWATMYHMGNHVSQDGTGNRLTQDGTGNRSIQNGIGCLRTLRNHLTRQTTEMCMNSLLPIRWPGKSIAVRVLCWDNFNCCLGLW